MRLLKPALLLMQYSIRQSMKSKVAFVMGLTVPLAYSLVFIVQILINYRINGNAFNNLPMSYYFTALFTSQTIVFTAWERSPRELAKSVLTADIDLLLLKPINLFYFKYFRYLDIVVPIMILLYISCMLISFSITNLPIHILGYIFVIIICGSLIKLNLRASVRGLIFFYRDILNTTRVEESLELLSQNKPPEVFPILIRTFLTLFLPVMLFNNSTFDVIRSLDTPLFWLLLFFWTGLAMYINKSIWSRGLQKYESIG
ncbi:MAG: ABC transporter permease [bacterium]|nr:ABC transporter permease [bacterium]